MIVAPPIRLWEAARWYVTSTGLHALEFLALPSLLFVQVSAFALRVSGTRVFSVKCDPVVLHPC